MREYYKPTENSTLRNYEFRHLQQRSGETFNAYCNRVEKEGSTCSFCDCAATSACTSTANAVRDQIVIGTDKDKIREQALLKGWDLDNLRKEGMKMESASRGEESISSGQVNKLGSYSFSSLKSKEKDDGNRQPAGASNTTKKVCFRCGDKFSKNHQQSCRATSAKCANCKKVGHYARVCKSGANVRTVQEDQDDEPDEVEVEEQVYELNIWAVNVKSGKPRYKSRPSVDSHPDFRFRLVVNNKVVSILADTGAKVSVCGEKQARAWGILDRMEPSSAKVRPYCSDAIAVLGEVTCGVTFNDRTVPVRFFILPGSCSPILSGKSSVELGIISIPGDSKMFNPIMMVDTEEADKGKNFSDGIQKVLSEYPQNFTGLGKLKGHSVKLYTDPSVKPVVSPPRVIPYHLRSRFNEAIETMIKDDVIELHPEGEPAHWVSCPVIVPKPDSSLRITLDARNVNKAVQSNNHPIPRYEDIKSKLGGKRFFSKLDFKSAFWQLELDPESRKYTVFYGPEGLLCRYKRLLMGIKPAQGELNMALRPLFSHLRDVFLIHDDLIIATETMEEHLEVIRAVMEAVLKAGLTLNPTKCVFGLSEVKFWGMLISKDGVRPDPEKVKALVNLSRPQNRTELKSFICMMQSNSDFIQNFAKMIAPLRDLLNSKDRFSWKRVHQSAFDDVLASFKEDTLLRYFNLSCNTYLFVDGHQSGLGAILSQGESIDSAVPVEFASRATSKAERNYPQLDLEAMAVDFALRRFRQYLIGAPGIITVVTDHHPLLSIFNGKRAGSIRTERIKMRHQNIRFRLVYKKGSDNVADYLSRHANPWDTLPLHIQQESNDLKNLLYTLRLSPILDALGVKEIALATRSDPVLSKLQQKIRKGVTCIHSDELNLLPFKKIFHEMSVLSNGTLLYQDRIVLPISLHEKAIKLAHSGAHPGQNGLARRLRSHFYIPNLDMKVEKWVGSCLQCQTFTDKTCNKPIQPLKVPERCWEEMFVDLFGPLPTKNHIVVIQDLSSRFPVAKVVSSTCAKKVIPVLKETYDTFGNPSVQRSDNGPPFNSTAMKTFTDSRGIEQTKIPPGHPSANNVETVMKPLGKAMKIGFSEQQAEKETLQQFLQNFRDTPHQSTGISPSSMLFRDGARSNLPRVHPSDSDIHVAKQQDRDTKALRKEKYNSSRHTKPSDFRVGEQVLARNFYKKSKFEPVFLPERYTVMDVLANGKIVLIQSTRTGAHLRRHPNDLKRFEGSFPDEPATKSFSESEILHAWREAFAAMDISIEDDGMGDEAVDHEAPLEEDHAAPAPFQPVARALRVRRPNPRIFNDNFVTG